MSAVIISLLLLGLIIESQSIPYHRSSSRLHPFPSVTMRPRTQWMHLYKLNNIVKDSGLKRLSPVNFSTISNRSLEPSEEGDDFISKSRSRQTNEKSALISESKDRVSSSVSNDHYMLQFDGGSRGNPGISGYGYVLRNSTGAKIYEAYGYLQLATNNEAEYNGLLSGLRYAKKLGINNLSVEGDSLLVIRQMKGEYAVKANNLKPLHREAKSLSNLFQDFSIRYIPREENKLADQLANKAMDRRESHG
jgi:ribonuclease HI